MPAASLGWIDPLVLLHSGKACAPAVGHPLLPSA